MTHQIINPKRHDHYGHQQVCNRQAHDEVVSNRLQRPLANNAHYHQHITKQREKRKYQQQQRPHIILWPINFTKTRHVEGTITATVREIVHIVYCCIAYVTTSVTVKIVAEIIH